MRLHTPVLISVCLQSAALAAWNPSGRYIVKLKDHVSTLDAAKHHQWVRELVERPKKYLEPPYASGLARTWVIGNIKGYNGEFFVSTADELRSSPDVDFIEPDPPLEEHTLITTPISDKDAMARPESPPWGLVRISHRDPPGPGRPYEHSPRATGFGNYVYILGTGLAPNLADFADRTDDAARTNTVPGVSPDDEDGLGTALAGIVAARAHGVVPEAVIVPVKIRHDAPVAVSALLAGLSMATQDITGRGRVGKAVVLVCASAGGSRLVPLALEEMSRRGILVVVSAGDAARGGDLGTPQSSGIGITVGAVREDDTLYPVSNFGKQVDLFAPGHAVRTVGRDGGTVLVKGTAAAAAHVAGLALYIMQLNHGWLGPKSVKEKMMRLTTLDKIKNLPAGTPNKIAYNKGGAIFADN